MPVVGIAEVLVTPVAKNAQRDIAKQFDPAAARAGRSAGRSMGSALGGALKLGAKVSGAAAVAGIGTALVKGFGRLQAIENARAKLSGLGHSASTVQSIMDSALESVKGTAFGLGDAASAAASAVASGVKPGKDLTRTLKLTGDAATIAGVGFNDMQSVMGKAAASNKVQGDILAQLGDMGIPIVQLLGKEMKLSAADVYAAGKKGEITFANLQDAIENGMGGAALKGGETMQGAFNNTVAAVGRIGANLLSGVYPKIQQFFAGAIHWLEPLEEGSKIAGEAIGVFIEKSIKGIQGLYDLLVKGDFTKAFREAFGVEEDSGLVDFLFNARDAFKVFMDSTVNVAQFLYDMRKPIGIIAGLIVASLIPHWVALGVEAIKSAVKQKVAWAMARGAAVKGAFVHSWAVTAMVAGWVLLGVQATIQAVKIAAAWLIALGPVGWVIGIILAVGAALVLAYNKVDWFRNMVDTAFNWIKDVAATAFGGVKTAVGAVVDWFQTSVAPIFKTVFDAVGGFFTDLWKNRVAPAWTAIQDIVGGVVSWFQNTVAPGIGSAVDAIGSVIGAIGGAFSTAFGVVVDAITTVNNAIVGVLAPVFSWLYNSVILPIWKPIGWVIKQVANVALLMFDLMVWGMKNVLAPAFVWLYQNVVVPTWNAIGGFIMGAWGVVKGIFTAIGVGVKAIGLVFSWLYKNVVVPVWNNIKTFLGAAWVVVKAIFVAMRSAVKNTVGAIFTWLYEKIIKPVWGGIKRFINDSWTGIKRIFEAVKKFIETVLAPAFRWLRDNVIKPVWDGIKRHINSVWAGIKAIFGAIKAFMRDTLAPAFRWLRDKVITPVWNGIKAAIKGTWEKGIKPVFQALGNFIKNTVAPAFRKGVSAIKTAWDRLKTVAKAPVKFIIDTVYNKGIVGTFNKIAKTIGSDAKLDTIKLPKGFARGGYTGPGRKFQEAGVVHADEFVLRKESTNKLRKRFGLSGLNHMNRFGELPNGYSDGGLVKRPVGGRVTSGFGTSRGKYPHAGIDFAVPIGTAVKAALAGVVEKAGRNIVSGRTGLGMLLGHPGGRNTYYGHLSSFLAKKGQQVSQGQAIARSGNTGNSSGPHLHFETWSGGKPLNPARFLGGDVLPQGAEGAGGGLFDILAPLTALKDKLMGQLRDKFPAGGMMFDAAKDVGKRMFNMVPEWAMSKLAAVGDFAKGVGSKVVGSAKMTAWATAALGRTGDLNPFNLASLLRRMQQESGGNPNAVNNWDSNAKRGTPSKGLMQVIGPTFAQFRDKALSSNIMDPLANIVASINYTKSRYGSLRGGWDRAGGYSDGGLVKPFLHDKGGVLNPGLSSILNNSRKPEAILNNKQWSDISTLAGQAAGGSSIHITVDRQATAQEMFAAAQFESRRMARSGA